MRHLARWTTVIPLVAVVLLGLLWGRKDVPALVLTLAASLLVAAVLAAVHHAEVVAHRVGEPLGSLVLALAVTIIEVGLIVMLMTSAPEASATLARDTLFAAVMITTNAIVGLTLWVAAGKRGLAYFNAEGSGAALATVLVLVVLTLVLPAVTTSAPGGHFTGAQLAFAAVMSLVVWAVFVLNQTVRHRDFFLPVVGDDEELHEDVHADPPSTRDAWTSLALLVTALVAVVGLAKVTSPAIESAVASAGLPASFVGVIIAIVVLSPETVAAARNASHGRTQVGLNLGYGSAMASIGLTVPAVALVVALLDLPLALGLGPVHFALLAVTALVGGLTVVPGRATRLAGALHLVIAAAYVFTAAVP